MSENHSFTNQLPWHDPEAGFWVGVTEGVALGIGAYPLVLAVLFELPSWIGQPISLFPNVVHAFAGASLGALVAHFLARILASMYGILCEKWLAVLNVNSRQLWIGAFVGGLVALTIIFPYVLPLLVSYERSGIITSILRALAYVMPVTALAQAGAIWGGRTRLVTSEFRTQADWRANLPNFSIAMLMWLMAGLCIAITALKLTGLPLDAIVLFLLAWLAAQAVTMVGLLLFERIYARLFENRGIGPTTPAD